MRISELGPIATAFYRLLFAMPALWLWYAVGQRRTACPTAARPVADIGGFVLAGLFFAGDLAVWHWSLRFTSVANATLFPNFAPVFVTLAGFLFFGERFSKMFLGGMTIAIAGASILMGESLNLGVSHLLGDALALATAPSFMRAISSSWVGCDRGTEQRRSWRGADLSPARPCCR